MLVGAWAIGQGFRIRTAGASARLFDQVLNNIAENYIDSIDVGSLYESASVGLVRQLGDPHSVFLDSTRLARVQAITSGTIGSLGLEVDLREGWVNVVGSLPGTPAEQNGIRAGDRIVAIEGRSTRTMTADEARRALRGNPGTRVSLTVERLGTARRTDLTLERERVLVPPVQRALMLERGIGYLQLRTFSDSAVIELTEAIDSLRSLGMSALVFDLRGNPGGLLSQGTEVADLFVDLGKAIVSLRGRGPDGNRDFVAQKAQAWGDLRLAVLIDRGTASAAEIVAGALQDQDRAIVIGRTSYGKGSAQSIFTFRDATGVKLTTARWYTPSGRNIDFDLGAVASEGRSAEEDSIARPAFRTSTARS